MLQRYKSLNIIKENSFSGELVGIKGQYLILDTGVINIRKYTSYEIDFEALETTPSQEGFAF